MTHVRTLFSPITSTWSICEASFRVSATLSASVSYQAKQSGASSVVNSTQLAHARAYSATLVHHPNSHISVCVYAAVNNTNGCFNNTSIAIQESNIVYECTAFPTRSSNESFNGIQIHHPRAACEYPVRAHTIERDYRTAYIQHSTSSSPAR